MRLEGEVARVQEMACGIGNIAPERLSTAGQEKRSFLPHTVKKRGLCTRKPVLERRVEPDVVLVVAEQIQPNLVAAGPGQVEVVERSSVTLPKNPIWPYFTCLFPLPVVDVR